MKGGRCHTLSDDSEERFVNDWATQLRWCWKIKSRIRPYTPYLGTPCVQALRQAFFQVIGKSAYRATHWRVPGTAGSTYVQDSRTVAATYWPSCHLTCSPKGRRDSDQAGPQLHVGVLPTCSYSPPRSSSAPRPRFLRLRASLMAFKPASTSNAVMSGRVTVRRLT